MMSHTESCVILTACGRKLRLCVYPKGPVSIYGHDEIDDINKKHEGVDVTHGAVVRVDDVIEELPDGEIDVKSSEIERKRARERETSHFALLQNSAS